jgi:hypothetical protein
MRRIDRLQMLVAIDAHWVMGTGGEEREEYAEEDVSHVNLSRSCWV